MQEKFVNYWDGARDGRGFRASVKSSQREHLPIIYSVIRFQEGEKVRHRGGGLKGENEKRWKDFFSFLRI